MTITDDISQLRDDVTTTIARGRAAADEHGYAYTAGLQASALERHRRQLNVIRLRVAALADVIRAAADDPDLDADDLRYIAARLASAPIQEVRPCPTP